MTPFHCAVGTPDGLAGLTFDRGHSGRSHIASGQEQQAFLVPVFDIARWDFLSAKIGGRPVHIKIDVEGYEADVLKAIVKAPWFSDVRSLVVEIDAAYLSDFGSDEGADIYNLLESLRFSPRFGRRYAPHFDEVFERLA